MSPHCIVSISGRKTGFVYSPASCRLGKWYPILASSYLQHTCASQLVTYLRLYHSTSTKGVAGSALKINTHENHLRNKVILDFDTMFILWNLNIGQKVNSLCLLMKIKIQRTVDNYEGLGNLMHFVFKQTWLIWRKSWGRYTDHRHLLDD